MIFIKGDYFNIQFERNYFDGIITDIPYKGAIKKKLNENNFSFKKFLIKTDKETKKDAFLITFSNFRCAIDIINISKSISNWRFHTYQIWDKRPIRNWISWTYPLRHVEFILYFTKGKFKFNFKDGVVKPAYKRSNFGGSLKRNNIANNNKYSYGMYEEVLDIIPKKKKIHPTEKPEAFSYIFKNIIKLENPLILDPFMGSGNLLKAFSRSIGVDLKNYRNFEEFNIENNMNQIINTMKKPSNNTKIPIKGLERFLDTNN
ncbi:MAG: DNA methyltransferase [Promethearchaeota archaeon]